MDFAISINVVASKQNAMQIVAITATTKEVKKQNANLFSVFKKFINRFIIFPPNILFSSRLEASCKHENKN